MRWKGGVTRSPPNATAFVLECSDRGVLMQSAEANLPIVELAQVLSGAVAFNEGNVSATYRGALQTRGGIRTAIIKDLTPKELANEVLAAAVALTLGLPVPPPYLAFAHPDRFTAVNGPRVGDGRLVYASVDVSQPQVAMLCRTAGTSRVLQRLAQWRQLGRLYGFDAFVANVDRHQGNLLFSGDQEVWLIDHGYCFTGPNWEPSDLAPPGQQTVCRLRHWLTPTLDAKQREARAIEAASIEADTLVMNLRQVATLNYVAALLEDGDFDAVLTFLNERRRHVPRLASSALEIETML